MLNEKGQETSLEDRKWFAKEAFAVSSGYDSAIFNYFDGREGSHFRATVDQPMSLRYGENPHQAAKFYGKFSDMFDQIHGKEISYNNLLDIDAAVNLIDEFDELTFATSNIIMLVVSHPVRLCSKHGKKHWPVTRFLHLAVS